MELARPPIPPKKRQSERGRGGRRGLEGRIPPRLSRSEAFSPFGVKPNIKAKHFSIPFKKNLAGGAAGRVNSVQSRFVLRSAIATLILSNIFILKWYLSKNRRILFVKIAVKKL